MTFAATELMKHQHAALKKMYGRNGFALLMEQGTGKTLVFIEEALQLYADGRIEGLFILAPNGVHENWILDQAPTHIPETIPARATYWCSDMNRKEKAALEWVTRPRKGGEVPPLRILSMSYDSLCTDQGWKQAINFIRSVPCLLVADESQRIKNPGATRTKRALNLRKYAKFKRIGTGTVATNSPIDVFSQFEFLEEGLLGTSSLPVFRAEYCELLQPGHGMLRHIVDRMDRARGGMTKEHKQKMLEKTQIVATDSNGMPIYKNLDRLRALIEPHAFRVLKEECLTLPPKTYETRYFHLDKKQRAVYDRMVEELRYILEDGTVVTHSKLVAMNKLRQITSGFILFRDGSTEYTDDNRRIALLRETVDEEPRQGIIWAQYKEEIANVVAELRRLGMTAEAVNGEVSMVEAFDT